MSIWGLSISSGKKYTKVAEQSFNLTAATLDLQSNHGNDVYSVMCEDDNGINHLICNLSLKHNIIQVPLDLQFYKGDKASFSVNGPEGNVHLTGSYLRGYDPDSDDDSEDEVEEEEEETPQLVTGKRKRKSPEEKSPKLSIKKQKLKNGESALKLADSKDSSLNEKAKNKKLKNAPKQKSTKKNAGKDDAMTLSDLLNVEEEEESDADEDFTMDGINVDDSDEEEGDEEEEEEEDDDDEEEEDEEEEGEEAEDEEEEYEDMDDEDVTDEEKEEESPLPSKKTAHSPGMTPIPQKNKKAKKAEKLGQSPSGNQAVTDSLKKKNKKNKQNKENENTLNGTPAKSPSGKTTKLAGGVVVQDLKIGTGPEVKNGKMVSLYYEGKLKNSGRVFDKQLSGDCFKFRVGTKEVIKGWDVGLMGMRLGGRRKIVIPPAMAYGAKGVPPAIPPNSALVFDVELKGIS